MNLVLVVLTLNHQSVSMVVSHVVCCVYDFVRLCLNGNGREIILKGLLQGIFKVGSFM